MVARTSAVSARPRQGDGSIAISAELTAALPTVPYRGIHAFRYLDHPIFFAREEETRRLVSLVSVYRGVLLFGETGAGKSSLVNAGLIPEMLARGFAQERVRVQPRAGEELVVERIATADSDRSGLLPSVLAPDDEGSPRTVLGIDAFEARVQTACEQHRPLLIFDQFEEIVTLFDGVGAREVQHRLIELVVGLVRATLPVKVLLSFRDDYLGKVTELLAACPELVDQALRISPPAARALPTIISGPFDRYPNQFSHPLPVAVREQLVRVLADRFGAGDLSLSEIQTVCLRLWQSDDPAALLAEKGPQGLLEDYLGEALEEMPAQLRPAAIALLSQLVTAAGTRNVISAADLFQRVVETGGDGTDQTLAQALKGLSESRLVSLERRRDVELYEITSEYLVPWISRRRDELRLTQERRRELRRLRILGSIAGALLVVAAGVVALAVWALIQRNDAQTESRVATSLALYPYAQVNPGTPLNVSLLLSLAALAPYHREFAAPAPIRSSMIGALEGARQDGLTAILDSDSGLVPSVAFSPDGRTLAAGDDDGTIVLWDPITHKQLGPPLDAHVGGSITSAAFTSNGRTLASGDDDGTVVLWDRITHKQLGPPLNAHAGSIESVAVSPDGRTLAAGDYNGTVALWDLAAHRQLDPPLNAHAGSVDSVAFSRDGRTLVAGNYSGPVVLWDVATHRQIRAPLNADTGSIFSVAFSPEGRTLAAGDYDGSVVLWDLTTRGQQGSRLNVQHGIVYSVAFSPDGRTLATGSAKGPVVLWDLDTRTQLGSPLKADTGGVDTVAFSPDRRTLATGDNNGSVMLWDLAAHTHSRLNAVTGGVDSVAFSPHGRTLATGDYNGSVELWDLAAHTHSRLNAVTNGVYSVAFSPHGGTLAAGDYDGRVVLWDLATEKRISSLNAYAGGVESVAFSPDGRTLAAGDSDGTVVLWDLASHQQLGAPLRTGTAVVYSVAFSPDGHTLATGDSNGTVELWDLATRRQLGSPLNAHTAAVESVAFSPTGRTVATGNSDGTANLFSGFTWADFAALKNEVCSLVGTGLTRAEWAKYAPGVPYRHTCP